jgi:hypothetical protein
LQTGDIELRNGIGVAAAARRSYHAPRDTCGSRRDDSEWRCRSAEWKRPADFAQKRFPIPSIEVHDDAIVGQNPELARREKNGQEPVVFLRAVMLRIRRAAFAGPRALRSRCGGARPRRRPPARAETLRSKLPTSDSPHVCAMPIRGDKVIERRDGSSPSATRASISERSR